MLGYDYLQWCHPYHELKQLEHAHMQLVGDHIFI